MLDFENIEYLIATRQEGTLALMGLTLVGLAVVVAPLLSILVPVVKLVANVAWQGLSF